MKTTLHTATFEDIPELSLMMEDFFTMFGYPFDRKIRTVQLNEILSHPDWAKLIVFKVNTLTAGYLLLSLTYSFEFGGRTGYIDELYLSPSFRGKGLGKVILKEVKKEAENLGLNAIRLEVEQSNAQAVKLYQSEAFSTHETRFLMTFMPQK